MGILLTILTLSIFTLGIRFLIDATIRHFFATTIDKIYQRANKWQKLIYKPAFACVYCISWTWGTVGMLCFGILPGASFGEWIGLVVCVAVVNWSIDDLIPEHE